MTNKLVPIKAVMNFRKMKPEAVLSSSNAIFAAMNANTNFVAPIAAPLPFDLVTLKTANDALAAANSAALDGGKKAVAQRDHQKEVVVKLLVQLGHYVEANSKDDMTIFLSSGFTAASTTKTATPPVSETIRKIEPGANSGLMLVTPTSYPGAGSYEVRWAPVPAGGNPTVWVSQSTLSIRQPMTISGLTPATTYVFQVRALTKAGFTDWGDPLTRVAV